MIRISRLLIFMLTITGCMTLPVQGVSTINNEVFTGTATGYMTGTGKLKFQSSLGAECTGAFKYYASHDKGRGAIKCNDGRQGDFTFTSTGVSGIGYGQMNDGTFGQFIFGDVSHYSEIGWHNARRTHSILIRQMSDMLYYCSEFPKTPLCEGR